MSAPQINPEMFEGKDFHERVALRKELISKYGTSLPAKDQGGSMFGKKDEVKDAQGNVIPERGDLEAFEGMDFSKRVEIRQKMIAAYGSSLPEADEEKKSSNKNSQEDSTKSNFNQRV
jgi:hypothetical protein